MIPVGALSCCVLCPTQSYGRIVFTGRTTRKATIMRTLIALLIAATITLLGATTAQAAPTGAVCDTDTSCAAWDAQHGLTTDGGPAATPLVSIPADADSAVSQDFLDALIGLGYTGTPGDGQEAILVPQDVALDLCVTDVDCMVAGGALYEV